MAYLGCSWSTSSMARLKELIYESAFTHTRFAKDEDINFINTIDP
jgi:hypothetical protein